MTARLLNGRILAEKIKANLKVRIGSLSAKTSRVPGLAYVLVGDDPVSRHYVAGKTRAARDVGIFSFTENLPGDVSEADLVNRIHAINRREDIHGLIIQLPLPPHIRNSAVVEAIDPAKDADGFHPMNRGLLFANHSLFVPCTPRGIVLLLKENGIEPEGKHVVILGRSLVVGRPLALLLLNENATVTVCHSKTPDIRRHAIAADILVAAVGKARFVRKEDVRPGAVVVDVGIHQVGDKLLGDVDFEEVSQVASAITPVPGGVGPMTVAMLLSNTLAAFERSLEVGSLTQEHSFRKGES